MESPDQLLPAALRGPWERATIDPRPGPRQFDQWATDLEIAVVFEAAVAVVRHTEEGNSVSVTAFDAGDAGIGGAMLAAKWVDAYACDAPQRVAIGGMAVEHFRFGADCRNKQYLLVFVEHLVVLDDRPDMNQRLLEPEQLAPVVDAIRKQALGDGE